MQDIVVTARQTDNLKSVRATTEPQRVLLPFVYNPKSVVIDFGEKKGSFGQVVVVVGCWSLSMLLSNAK